MSQLLQQLEADAHSSAADTVVAGGVVATLSPAPPEPSLTVHDYKVWQLVATAPMPITFDAAEAAMRSSGGNPDLAFAILLDG